MTANRKERTFDRRLNRAVRPDSSIWDNLELSPPNSNGFHSENGHKKPRSGRQARRERLWGSVDGPRRPQKLVVEETELTSLNGDRIMPLLALPEGESVTLLSLPEYRFGHFDQIHQPTIDKYKKPRGTTQMITSVLPQTEDVFIDMLNGLSGYARVDAIALWSRRSHNGANDQVEEGQGEELKRKVSFSRAIRLLGGYDVVDVPETEMEALISSLCKKLPGKDKRLIHQDVQKLLETLRQAENGENNSFEFIKPIEDAYISLPLAESKRDYLARHRLYRLDAREVEGIGLNAPSRNPLSLVYARLRSDDPQSLRIAIMGVYTFEQYKREFSHHKGMG